MVKHRDRLKSYLFSNGSIRLLMEAYLNLFLFSLLNISKLDWDGKWLGDFGVTRASAILSLTVFTLTAIFPFIFFVHYCRNRGRWADKDFIKKYGTFITGLKHDQVLLLLLQVMFFVRRIVLSVSLVYWQWFLVG